ncbi:MAG TPA: 4Fe-4S dicluster domain-containing protein [Chitinivibrionales bacterium]|nr:4Fe-4S dicluster domain-containing protein [Chitinivibrionales bacterium]
MELQQISRKELLDFVGTLAAGPLDLFGVVQKDGRFAYDRLSSGADLRLDFDETMYSPKQYLFPPRDPVLSYAPKDASSCEPVYAEKDQAIIGIHPGDLAAIAMLDKAFTDGKIDANYCTRREKTTLVGIYPTKPGTYRFTSSMIKPEEPYLAADAFLIDMGDASYALEIVTDRGKEFFSASAAKPAGADVKAKAEKAKTAVKDAVTLQVKRDALPSFRDGKERHPAWETRGAKCFSCGSCVTVCPTCYCFDMLDELDLSFEYGLRFRMWDACVLEPFAVCAGGHNFRKKAADRIRHRLYRKQKFLLEKFGIAGCVGCGRCKKACTADIAYPPDIDADLLRKEA